MGSTQSTWGTLDSIHNYNHIQFTITSLILVRCSHPTATINIKKNSATPLHCSSQPPGRIIPTPNQSHQVAPDSNFTLNSNSVPYMPSYQSQPTPLKLHQPAATRVRNAIPIVNPSTGMSMASPPQSVSPARMQHLNRRW